MPSRTIRRILLALVLTIVIGVLGFLAVFWLKPSAIENLVKQEALPRLSQALGQKVNADDIDIGLFPPQVKVNDVVISGRPGKPPIATLERIVVSIRVWPLLRSAGQEVSFQSITLTNPQINLVRSKDGTWNYQTLDLQNLQTQESEREVFVSSIRVQNGEIHIIDRSGAQLKEQPETIVVRNIDLEAKDFSRNNARVFLSAAVMADERNFWADFSREKSNWAGKMRLESLDVNRLPGVLPAGIDEAITGGRVVMQATLGSDPKGKQLAEGRVQIPDLALRGNAKHVNTAFDFMVALPSIENGSLFAEITDLQINGPGVIVLSGAGTISGEPLVANFSLTGPLVNLDALLGVSPAQQTTTPILALPASVPESIAKLRATGKLEVDQLIIKTLSASRVVASAELQEGVLTITRATANLYGGKMNASNAVVNLTEPFPSWELHSNIQRLNIGDAFQEITGEKIIIGKFNGRINLQGKGDQWEHLKTNMTGGGSFTLVDGSLDSLSIEEALTGSIAEALRIGGIVGTGLPPRTPFQSITGAFTLRNGQMIFSQPISMQSSAGSLSLRGTLGLDQQLSFHGTAQLSPEFVEEVAGIRPSNPIDAPLTLTGLLSSPQIQIDSSVIAEQMVRQMLPGNIL